MNTPNIRELFPVLAKRWDEEEAIRVKQSEALRQECANAMEAIASAIRRPRISRIDLEAAQMHVTKALITANLLDPKDEVA